MKILTTGGHLTPALAFIDYVRMHAAPDTEFVFLGRELSQVANKQYSQENTAISERHIKFVPFQSGKLSFHTPLELFSQVLSVFRGFFSALRIVGNERPDIVVVFGGYIAVPVAVASWLKQIPVITHEQTAVASLSNQIIGFFCKKIAISQKSSLVQFPQKKVVMTGNLLRHKLEEKQPLAPEWFLGPKTHPLLYITGGNQGSEVINTTIAQILPQLTKDWTVIHQCGAPTKMTNYKMQLQNSMSQLSIPGKKRYFVREWIAESELAWLYANAALVISRSGANTVFELEHFGIPAIFIPLPFSHKQEQLKNAELAQKSGGSIIIPQNHLSPETLLAAIKKMGSSLTAKKKRILERKTTAQGNQKLWKLVLATQKTT